MKEEDIANLLNKEENEGDPWDLLSDEGFFIFINFKKV